MIDIGLVIIIVIQLLYYWYRDHKELCETYEKELLEAAEKYEQLSIQYLKLEQKTRP